MKLIQYKKLLQVSLFAAALGAVGSLTACSSSRVGEEGEAPSDLPAPSADAGTDAVPKAPDATAAGGPDAPSGDSAGSTGSSSPPIAMNGTDTYTVQAGDTLMKIAFESYGDLYQWRRIYDMNKDKISDPAALKAGTVLTLDKPASPVQIERNGDKYVVKVGDTLGTISTEIYGTPKKWKKLWENNRQMIHDPNKIYAGFTVYYSQTPEEREQMQKMKNEVTPAPMAAVQNAAKAAVSGVKNAVNRATGAAQSRAPASTGYPNAPIPLPH